VEKAGIKHARYFPREPGDNDELPNEVATD